MPLRISAEHDSPDAISAPVVEGLRAFNLRHMPHSDFEPLKLLLRDEGGVVRGGLLASCRWQWLLVNILWVEDALRGRGHGRALLERAEAIAWGRGCRRAVLDTTEFQARGFYQAVGYRVFGELADYPPGSRTFYLEKTLACPDQSDPDRPDSGDHRSASRPG